MGKILLVKPTKEHEAAAWAFRQTHLEEDGGYIHGGAFLEEAESYDAWLEQLDRLSSPETTPEGWSPASTFFSMREVDGTIVGMVDIRHVLVPALRAFGGHIGYEVAPAERRKGYATQILELALRYSREVLGLSEVMLSCAADNEASRRTIVRAGGVLEMEAVHPDGSLFQKYWIKL